MLVDLRCPECFAWRQAAVHRGRPRRARPRSGRVARVAPALLRAVRDREHGGARRVPRHGAGARPHRAGRLRAARSRRGLKRAARAAACGGAAPPVYPRSCRGFDRARRRRGRGRVAVGAQRPEGEDRIGPPADVGRAGQRMAVRPAPPEPEPRGALAPQRARPSRAAAGTRATGARPRGPRPPAGRRDRRARRRGRAPARRRRPARPCGRPARAGRRTGRARAPRPRRPRRGARRATTSAGPARTCQLTAGGQPPATAGRIVTSSPSATGRRQAVEEADVLPLHVDVDEAAQLAVLAGERSRSSPCCP